MGIASFRTWKIRYIRRPCIKSLYDFYDNGDQSINIHFIFPYKVDLYKNEYIWYHGIYINLNR